MVGNMFFWAYLLCGAFMALVCIYVVKEDFSEQEELLTIPTHRLVAGFSFVLLGLLIAFWLHNLASFAAWGTAVVSYWMHILLVVRAKTARK